tara:strand:- start:201 stop:1409 length:1209 start_codon:yes stop_codon:yes gene_type:complete
MANSTSASLKLTVQATGENSGTWGQITNTNLLILEQAIGGYQSIAVTSGATLTFTNGAVSNGKNQILKLTGTIAGTINVVVPDSVEKTYIIQNSTSGAYAVTVKTTSGTGVTWAATDKGIKEVYSDGTNIVDTAFTKVSSDYTPQLSADLDCNAQDIIIDSGNSIQDDSNNEYIKFVKTGSAVNEISITNKAAGGEPSISATGDDTDISLDLIPKGTGQVTSAGVAMGVSGKETIWVPATTMYPTTTAGANAIALTELTAGTPEINTIDFDAGTEENAQFTVALPKSWNLGTITYQVFWTGNSTNTGDCIWGLKGVAIADAADIDTAFGTAITVTDAHAGTADYLDVSSESTAMTIAGSPAAGEQCFFNFYRDADAGGDTFSADARLVGIKLHFTTNAPNDA